MIFYYGADGRFYKKVVATAQTTEEMYIKDALGRDLAVVKFTSGVSNPSVEYFVFGNERIARVTSITGAKIYPTEATFFLYDHLGNTRVAFQYSTANGSFPHTIVNAMDYYPYGKMLREYDMGEGDRYLTTNHERDKETGLDYRGARYYDCDVARFLSLDPMASKYPSLNAYNYVGGMPIIAVDPDGKEIWIINEYYDSKGMFITEQVRYCDGILYTENGDRYSGNNEYFQKVSNDLQQLSKDDQELDRRIEILQDSKNVHKIGMPVEGEYNSSTSEDRVKAKDGIPTGSVARYDPDNWETVRKEEKRTPRASLAHEFLSHSWDTDQGTKKTGKSSNGIDLNEIDAVNIENIVREITKDSKRTTYGGIEIPKELLK